MPAAGRPAPRLSTPGRRSTGGHQDSRHKQPSGAHATTCRSGACAVLCWRLCGTAPAWPSHSPCGHGDTQLHHCRLSGLTRPRCGHVGSTTRTCGAPHTPSALTAGATPESRAPALPESGLVAARRNGRKSRCGALVGDPGGPGSAAQRRACFCSQATPTARTAGDGCSAAAKWNAPQQVQTLLSSPGQPGSQGTRAFGSGGGSRARSCCWGTARAGSTSDEQQGLCLGSAPAVPCTAATAAAAAV